MKKIVMPLAAGVLLTAGAQAQTKIAIEGQAYVITGTAASVTPSAAAFTYEWYRNNEVITGCTAATCTVPANLCNGVNVVFKRKLKVTSGCAGDTEGFTNEVTVSFKCGGGHGTKIGNVCWADRNVGAAGAFTATAHEYSPFYQWNKNKAWAATGSINNFPNGDNSSTWTVNPNPCPTGWRLPTQAEFSALNIATTGRTWANANAKGNTVAGVFAGTNHTSCSLAAGGSMSGCIFLPACGYRTTPDGVLDQQGSGGYYWSSDIINSSSAGTFANGSIPTTARAKQEGLSVRCVQ